MKINFSKSVLEDEDQVWRHLIHQLDQNLGCFFACDYTYPGRYTPWQIGTCDPLIRIQSSGLYFELESLKVEGNSVLMEVYDFLKPKTFLQEINIGVYASNSSNDPLTAVIGSIHMPDESDYVEERERSRQNSIFTLLRALLGYFETDCPLFGAYGNYGYSLIHQFETLERGIHCQEGKPDLLLYLPQVLVYKANPYEKAVEIRYEYELSQQFEGDALLQMLETQLEDQLPSENPIKMNLEDYENMVKAVKPLFEKGDLFEVVPSYDREHTCKRSASEVFENLRAINPSPFHYLINTGSTHLIGASPEMYLKAEAGKIETCPISGTLPRGHDSLSDAKQIRQLLNSQKDEDELTMCTDVDRNDKSKVCEPSTIQVIGRRQIEMYSHLIHTVDHVTGILRPEMDGIDAFIAHMWAVTVTGAPKKAAMNWIETHEKSPRGWYGGATGYMTCNGNINTGLTLRGILLKDEKAIVRVGATVLYDSDPALEAIETEVKARAMETVISIMNSEQNRKDENCEQGIKQGIRKKTKIEIEKNMDVLVIDHDDSFVHTLTGYFEKLGCKVKTIRQSKAAKYFEMISREGITPLPELMILSPGPGTPEDFKLHDSIEWAVENSIPIFGVCLGLQGLVTYFGGSLGQLETPVHGKASQLYPAKALGFEVSDVSCESSFENPTDFNGLFQLNAGTQLPRVGRYHSLYAKTLPESLCCYAVTEDFVPMAIYHKTLPIWAVQFHPESIMSSEDNFGKGIIENLIQKVRAIKDV